MELTKTLHALERAVFSLGADPIVVALKGGWGEGKTTFWKKSVAADRGEWEPGYVSVFGVESLAAIQRDVAAEAIRTRPKGNAGETLQKAVETAYPYLKAAKGLINAVTGSFGFSLDAFNVPPDVLQRFALREGWTICLDDIERLPDSIELDSLFGYVSALRDEYKINVVLIYNEEKVPSEKQEKLRRYAEKVVDRDIPFIPSPADIAVLGLGNLSRDAELLAFVAPKCALLQLRNIRILRRFKRYYEDTRDALPNPVDGAYLKTVANSLLLFSWVRFANVDARDLTLEFLEVYQGIWPDEPKGGRKLFPTPETSLPSIGERVSLPSMDTATQTSWAKYSSALFGPASSTRAN